MLVNCGINRREFLQQSVLVTAALSMPQTKQDSPQAEYAITLGTWPHRIYKENDGLLEPASTESFVFNLLVKESQNPPLDPLSARLAFYAAEDKVHMLELSRNSDGRSQHFAYDILGTGPHWEITRNGGAANADIYGWGREVIAPADATVIYARNDVPDQPVHGVIDPKLYETVPNQPANPGNQITLDHGSGEYSDLGHMQRGSIRVETGDRVRQGQVLGLIGSAGDSHLPHLHYQFQMSGKPAYLADGLPSRFENVTFDLFEKPIPIASPKRGMLLEAH